MARKEKEKQTEVGSFLFSHSRILGWKIFSKSTRKSSYFVLIVKGIVVAFSKRIAQQPWFMPSCHLVGRSPKPFLKAK